MNKMSMWNQSAPRLLTVLVEVAALLVSWLVSPSLASKETDRTLAAPMPFETAGDHGSGNWQSFAEMHDMYVNRFVNSQGFGFSRMAPTAELRTLMVNGQPHRTRRIELISLDSGPKPFAYVPKYGNPTMKNLATVETRELMRFELDAIRAIRSGRDVVFNGDASKPEIVGAIRATDSCLNCHLAKPGELLGCMSYELLPVRHPDRLRQPVP